MGAEQTVCGWIKQQIAAACIAWKPVLGEWGGRGRGHLRLIQKLLRQSLATLSPVLNRENSRLARRAHQYSYPL